MSTEKPSFEELKDQFSHLIKGMVGDLFVEEDKQFMEWAAKDMATLRLKFLTGEYKQAELDREERYTYGAVKLAVTQKTVKIKDGFEDLVVRALEALSKAAVGLK